MTSNKIACIIFLIIGILFAFITIYQIICALKEDEHVRFLLAFISCIVSITFIVSAIVYWNYDNKYKQIKCKEFKIEENITRYTNGNSDITYVIYYK